MKFADSAEDCNCHCVAITRAMKVMDADEMTVLQEGSGKIRLDKTKDFADFKAKYNGCCEVGARIYV
ncbi:MAG: hypothetical protein IJB69_10565 [Clostridia bacterium]|nr:hypothetical protein [Clostridia bacterium]